jgi:putative phosphoribosyl transferase
MKTPFPNREEAGRLLADKLSKYAGHQDVVILALPRGGVAVAAKVAAQLNAPLDVLVVRKLGVPGQSEVAMGAVAGGGICILNDELIDQLNISGETVREIIAHELAELRRREMAYRGGRPVLQVKNKTAILIDDGVATGSTMRAAIHAIRKMHPTRVVMAVPVLCAAAHRELICEVDEIVALVVPEEFFAVGEWYQDFSQLTDEDVRRLVGASSSGASGPEPAEWSPRRSER